MSLPLCQRPGCVKTVKKLYNRRSGGRQVPVKYCSPQCYYGSDDHKATTSAMRRKKNYGERRSRFAPELARLTERITREELTELFAAVYRRGYNSGYRCAVAQGRQEREGQHEQPSAPRETGHV